MKHARELFAEWQKDPEYRREYESLCDCGAPWGTLHACDVLPTMDGEGMMGLEPEGDE